MGKAALYSWSFNHDFWGLYTYIHRRKRAGGGSALLERGLESSRGRKKLHVTKDAVPLLVLRYNTHWLLSGLYTGGGGGDGTWLCVLYHSSPVLVD